MVPWADMSQLSSPNGISIGSAVFAQLSRVPKTQTDAILADELTKCHF